jgi:hypothetical protein
MSNRVLRAGFLALPLLSLSFGLIVACTDDENASTGGRDASSDVAAIDGSTNTGDGSTIVDAGRDARDSSIQPTDSGSDADADAEPPIPLCTTYPDTLIAHDAGSDEEGAGPFTRWQLIAFRAIVTGAFPNGLTGAINSCELQNYLDDPGQPYPDQCLAKQLAALTGCQLAGSPAKYDNTTQDTEGASCYPDAGNRLELGLENTGTTPYTYPDVDLIIKMIVEAAKSTGMADGDANRLKAILEARRPNVAFVDAGDAGYSNSNCP